MLVVDWRSPIPTYIKFLHTSATETLSADAYTKGHIAEFLIRDTDVMLCGDLKDISMVFLVYKERPDHAHDIEYRTL